MAAIAGVGRKDVSNLIRDRSATLREIAFIDRNVDDLETLLAGLRLELDPILLSDDEPALRQMSRLVRDWDGLEAIHVIAHGRVGEVSFGAGALSLESLAGHVADLRTGRRSVTMASCCSGAATRLQVRAVLHSLKPWNRPWAQRFARRREPLDRRRLAADGSSTSALERKQSRRR